MQGRKIKCLNGSYGLHPNWPNDDSKFVEFLFIHKLLNPVWLAGLYTTIFFPVKSL